ncbi:MAG: PilN domain-containing protein [Planctomycetes bacterium]|nr:PilN domain-containing protein [Planctomycetota bacterium]
MSKIDFLPNDYVQQRDSSRVNFLYFVLLGAVMAGIAITFLVIKVRQRSVQKELTAITVSMGKAREQMELVEQLQAKGKSLMQTASITTGLPDLIPRTIILACLTNSLPEGVSLLDLKITDNEVVSVVEEGKSKSQYAAASAALSKSAKTDSVPVRVVDTNIEITGIAPSDIEVAKYIAKIGNSLLLDNVGLVESKEHVIDDVKFRRFKLQAVINRREKLTSVEVKKLRLKRKEIM